NANPNFKPTNKGAGSMKTAEEQLAEKTQQLADANLKLSTIEADRKALSDAGFSSGAAAVEKIKDLTGQVKTLSEKAAQFEEAQKLAVKEAAFTKLLSEKKAVPAQKDAYMAGDMAKFAELA